MRSFSSFQRYRKWQKVIEPLIRYNRNSSSLGYPLNFFDQLQQLIAAGHPLALNIATTLTGSKDNCIKTVFSYSEDVGKVVFTPSILKSTFDAEIEKEMQERLAKFCQKDGQFEAFYNGLKQSNSYDQMMPLVVLKENEGKGGCGVRTLNKDQNKKTTTLQGNQIAQGFILNGGKQSSIIRFFYCPKKQNNQAYKIDNLQSFMKRRFCKSQFKVQEQSQNSLTFVKIMYSNKSFYNQTLSLVDFLEKHLKITINKIATDWILDPHNRYYLIDVKEIVYNKVQDVVHPQRSLTQALAYLTCEVCQQKFKADEINKILTARMINQFFQHLKKRQIDLSFSISNKHAADTCRVCDLCYMLVVSEAELIELQKKIATLTHSISDNRSSSDINLMTGDKGKLHQWRLFIYLQDIRDLVIQNIDPKASYYIMVRIHNSITSFKILNPKEKYHLIKGIKIHYLFSEGQKIEHFLINSAITIRITKGSNWNSVIAEGNTSGLYEQNQKHSMRKFKQILVFNQKSQYSVVGIHIGVKMEGQYDPTNLHLHKTYDVYMVQDGYSNCYALPAEWMETIDPSYCISKDTLSSFSYNLHIGSHEKKVLLPSLIPKDKKRLKL